MNVCILDEAQRDLVDGYAFYEAQESGLGDYFLDSLFSDIDSLQLSAGIRPRHFGCFRRLSKRFPFAVYSRVRREAAYVWAVLRCRRNPVSVEERLKRGQKAGRPAGPGS